MRLLTEHPHLCANVALIVAGIASHVMAGLVYGVACFVIAVCIHGLWMRAIMKRACRRSAQATLRHLERQVTIDE